MRAVSIGDKPFKLDRMRTLLDKLDRPQDDFQSVHIAGTVGKGSTVAMIASMLRACGYGVGEFTSPHLIDMRERIRINGQMIGRPDFIDVVKRVSEAARSLKFEPTFFEMITAVGFTHFAEQAVDLAVVETGLGGRLDCTNVITPEVSAITLIARDHMHLLGDTLPKIAREKAGILKRGVPAFTIEQEKGVEGVLRTAAEKAGVPLRVVNKDIEFSCRFGASAGRNPHTQVCLFTATSRFEHLPVPLPGEHQAFNCGLALAVIDFLKSVGYTLPEIDVHRGLSATTIPGRMELVWKQPRILVDGAHNPVAVGALMRSVGAHVPYDSMVCIFGCCEDKDIPAMLKKLALGADKVIFTRAKGIARAADPEFLQQMFSEHCKKTSQPTATIGDALKIASRAVGREDLICVTGSFYLVGETKKYLAERAKKRR